MPSALLAGRVGRVSADRLSQTAKVTLVVFVLVSCAGALWSSHFTSLAARRAVVASTLADRYADVAQSVTAEQSLAQSYRLAPAPTLRVAFNAAAAAAS